MYLRIMLTVMQSPCSLASALMRDVHTPPPPPERLSFFFLEDDYLSFNSALARNMAAVAPTSKVRTRSRILICIYICTLWHHVRFPVCLPLLPTPFKKSVCKTELIKKDKLNKNNEFELMNKVPPAKS